MLKSAEGNGTDMTPIFRLMGGPEGVYIDLFDGGRFLVRLADGENGTAEGTFELNGDAIKLTAMNGDEEQVIGEGTIGDGKILLTESTDGAMLTFDMNYVNEAAADEEDENASEDNAAVAGRYALERAEQNGMDLTAMFNSMAGEGGAYFELAGNGKFKLKIIPFDEWALKGRFEANGNVISFTGLESGTERRYIFTEATVEGGKISIDLQEITTTKMVFGKK